MSTPGDEDVAALPGVAPRLRELRRRRGLTLEAAAQRAGLSPAHLSRLETGARQPSLPMLLALARIYGTTVSELLGEMPPEREPVIRAGRAAPREADGWTLPPDRGTGPRHAGAARRGPVRHPARAGPGPPRRGMALRPDRTAPASLGDATHELDPGDSAHFDSLTPHRISAASHGGAELLFVHTLLQSPDPHPHHPHS